MSNTSYDRLDLSSCLTYNSMEGVAKFSAMLKRLIQNEHAKLSLWPSIQCFNPNASSVSTLKWIPCIFREHYRGVASTKVHLLWMTTYKNAYIAVRYPHNGLHDVSYRLDPIEKGYPKHMKVFSMSRCKFGNILDENLQTTPEARVTLVGCINAGYDVDICYNARTNKILCTEVNPTREYYFEDDTYSGDDDDVEEYNDAYEFATSLEDKRKEVDKAKGDMLIYNACMRLGIPIHLQLSVSKKEKSRTNLSIEGALREMKAHQVVSNDFSFQLTITDIERGDTGKWHGVWDKTQINWVVYGAPPVSSYFKTVKGKTLLHDIVTDVLLPKATPFADTVYASLFARVYSDGNIVLDDYSNFIPAIDEGVPLDVLLQDFESYEVQFSISSTSIIATLYGVNKAVTNKPVKLSTTTYTYDKETGTVKHTAHDGTLLLHMLYSIDSVNILTLLFTMLKQRTGRIKLEGSMAPSPSEYRNKSANFEQTIAL